MTSVQNSQQNSQQYSIPEPNSSALLTAARDVYLRVNYSCNFFPIMSLISGYFPLCLQLKKRYLTELKALLSDCNWLRTNLAIDGTRGTLYTT